MRTHSLPARQSLAPSRSLPASGRVGVPVALAAAMLAAGCTSGPASPSAAAVPGAVRPTGSPVAGLPGALDTSAMSALLVQGDDVPGLSLRRTVDPYVEQTSSPQLGLCRAAGPALPHQVANVLAKGSAPGQALVFEVVSVYADAAAAEQAWAYDVASARACPAFTSGAILFTVAGPDNLDVPVGKAVQYRLSASDVVSGDQRTLAVRGRATVFLSGYGKPADGSDLAAYQADIARKAVRRLPAA